MTTLMMTSLLVQGQLSLSIAERGALVERDGRCLFTYLTR